MTDTVEIPLTQGAVAIVDVEDAAWIQKLKWYVAEHDDAGRVQYAMHSDRGKTIVMHRMIMGASDAEIVNHTNGNTLDNRRANLRLCSQSEIQATNGKRKIKCTSKYKGVFWAKENGKWRVGIRIDGKMTHLGLFSDEEEAAQAYDEAAVAQWGEFAHLNNPYGENQ